MLFPQCVIMSLEVPSGCTLMSLPPLSPPYLSQWFFQSARQESQTCRCRAFAQIIQREPPQVGYVDSDWFIPEGICIFI